MSFWNYVGVYFLGGVTLIPGAVLLGFYMAPQKESITLTESLPEPQDLDPSEAGQVKAATTFHWSPYFVNLSDNDDEFVLAKQKARTQLKKSLDPVTTTPKTTLAKIPKYYGAVRGHYLELWQDETKIKRVSTIDLRDYVVTLWPSGAQDFELFYKRYPICLLSRTAKDGLVALDLHWDTPPTNAHFIYIDNPCAKEDLYFALIEGSRSPGAADGQSGLGPRDPNTMAKPIAIQQDEVDELLFHIYGSNRDPQTQWLNALLGRIFLAVKKSYQLDEYIRNKIIYKLNRVKPNFIRDIAVKNIHVGSSLPYFNNIRNTNFLPDGSMTLEADVLYSGGFSLDVEFICVLKVPGFSSREFRCVLAVKLCSLKGKLVVQTKPPPSSHLWYGFKEMPEMDLQIEPTVANRQVGYSFITNALKTMLSDAVKESMVLPYMDDIPFLDTTDEFYRGGIWDSSVRPQALQRPSATQKPDDSSPPRSEHEVIVKDDASVRSGRSTRSTKSAAPTTAEADTSADASTASASGTRSVTSFWNNLIKRKGTTRAAATADHAVEEPQPPVHLEPSQTTTSQTATLRSSPKPDDLAPSSYTPPSHDIPTPSSGASTGATTAVTSASVHGVQTGMFNPPKTFASRKPVPGVVTATNADFEPKPLEETQDSNSGSDSDEKDPIKSAHQVPRKPVPTLRSSRSIQQLNRVVSRSQRSVKGHSPTSSISSRRSVNSKRSGTVTLQNLDPEPEPRNSFK